MLTFDEFLTERYQIGRSQAVRTDPEKSGKRTKKEEVDNGQGTAFDFVFKYMDKKFVPSIHSASQAHDRRPDFTKDDWKKLHRAVGWYMKEHRIQNGMHLFYSRKVKQGYISNVRLKGREVDIVTVLPKGHYDPRGGGKNGGHTVLDIVESVIIGLDEFGLLFEGSGVTWQVHIID